MMNHSHVEFLENLRQAIFEIKQEENHVVDLKLLEQCKDELECMHHNFKVQLDITDRQYKILLQYIELLEHKGYSESELMEIAHNTTLEHMGLQKQED